MLKNIKVPQDVKIIIMGNAFVFNPYLQYRYNSDNEYHTKYFLAIYSAITITLCLLATTYSSNTHELDWED